MPDANHPSRPAAGRRLGQAAAAGFLAAAPLALWALSKTVSVNPEFSTAERVLLGVAFLLVYGCLGAVVGATAGLGSLALPWVRRGWLAGALPVLVLDGALIARARAPLLGARAMMLGAAIAAALGLALAFTVVKHRGGRLAIGLALALEVALVFAIRSPAPAGGHPAADSAVIKQLQAAPPPSAPLLVVGLDGAEWEILHELLPTGTLPNLSRLIDEGAYSPLRSREPTWSPSIWTTIWTGKLPAEHGITFFLAGGTYSLPGEDTPLKVPRIFGLHRLADVLLKPREVPVTSRLRTATTVWEIAGLAGRISVLANRLVSWPALPLRGVELSTYLCYENSTLPALTYPEDVTAVALARLRRATPVSDPGLAPTPWLSERLGRERVLWDLGAEYARDNDASLVVMYTHLIDSAHHRYLKYYWPDRFRFEVNADDVETFHGVIPATYRAIDAMIGEVLSILPAGYRVLVLSDHGVRPNLELTKDEPEVRGATTMPPASLQSISGVHGHAPDGIFVLHGPGVRPGPLPEEPSVLDIAPLMLSLLNLPPASDMEVQEPLTVRDPGLVQDVTVAEAVPTYEGLIRRTAFVAHSGVDAAVLEEFRALGYIN